MGMGPFWGGAECARAMFSVIATVCASLILLETASGAFLSAVLLPVFNVLHVCYSRKMSTGNSVQAQDNLQPGPSGSGTVLGSQPSTETGISQVANLTSGELQIKKKKKKEHCV